MLLEASLSTRTRQIYDRYVNEYLVFSSDEVVERFQQMSLGKFIAKLHLDGLASATILTYVSALKFYCKRHNVKNDLDSPQTKSILKGARNVPLSIAGPPKNACTINQLQRLVDLAKIQYSNYEAVLICSMFSMAFFGFLRVSEYALTPAGHTLKYTGCTREQGGLTISLLSSKTSKQRVALTLGKFEPCSAICPVALFDAYVRMRPATASPYLFIRADKTAITSSDISRYLSELSASAGFAGITSHSFRIGGATWAARAGWSDAAIRAHGRWHSNAFLNYVRPV